MMSSVQNTIFAWPVITACFLYAAGLPFCFAQAAGLTTITLNGNTVTNVTEVRVLKETGKVLVLWSGGVGSYEHAMLPGDFLDSWGIKRIEVTTLADEKQAAQTEATQRKIQATRDFAASYPGLGHIDEIKKMLVVWNSGLKNMRRYNFSAASINKIREQTKLNPKRPSFNPFGMEIERYISSTFPLTVYDGTATNGMRITIVAMHTNVLRIRITGVNRLVRGTEANTMKILDLHLVAGLIEGTIERSRSGGDDSIISKMLQRQVQDFKGLGRYHSYTKADAYLAFSCVEIRPAACEYMLNICDRKLGDFYDTRTGVLRDVVNHIDYKSHPDAPYCPAVLSPEGWEPADK